VTYEYHLARARRRGKRPLVINAHTGIIAPRDRDRR
jgi:hypothetical protein